MEKPTNRKAWKDLRPRILTGVALSVVTFIALWQGDMVFTFFIAFCAVAMLHEWRSISAKIHPLLGLLGIPYILVPCLSLIGLRMLYFPDSSPVSMWPTLYVITVVAATDTGAFIAGRSIGGPKLLPSVSPAKTWVGLLGGMACGVLMSLALYDRVSVPGSFSYAISMGMVLSVISQCGDLFESWIKRLAGIKDSGILLPGHGGILDRVDGLMFAAPVYFTMNLLAGGRIL